MKLTLKNPSIGATCVILPRFQRAGTESWHVVSAAQTRRAEQALGRALPDLGPGNPEFAKSGFVPGGYIVSCLAKDRLDESLRCHYARIGIRRGRVVVQSRAEEGFLWSDLPRYVTEEEYAEILSRFDDPCCDDPAIILHAGEAGAE